MNPDPANAGRRLRRLRGIHALAAGLAALCLGEVAAQVPPVPAPAFLTQPNTFQPGQLLYRMPNMSRVTNIAYHNGILYTHDVAGGRRKIWQWSNPANVTSLAITADQSAGASVPLFNDQGNHAHTKVGDWLGGFFAMTIKRTGLGVNSLNTPLPTADNFLNRQPATANSSARHRLYYPWAVGFDWVQYAGGNRGSLIYRGAQLIADFNPLADHGVTGTCILMGNILLVISDESATGILSYDIGPSLANPGTPPVLLDKLTGHIGAYIGVLWEHYIVLSRRDTNTVDIVDWSDPRNLRFVTSIDASAEVGGNVPYTQAQDHFIFTQAHKINMETFRPELVLDLMDSGDRPAGSVAGAVDVSQYMMPLGPFLVTGAYSFTGRDAVGIWAHQTGPDNRAPYVGYHVPRDGQTNYPLGAPISILIHETLESFTIVNGESIILREVGTTTPIACFASFSHDDILTLTPRAYLQPNKTYEVIIPGGGIKDAAGNGILPYSFTFSTGSNIAGSINQSPVISALSPSAAPVAPGTAVTFVASASDAENDPLEYRYTFGDGSTPTAWSASSQASHTFTAPGHFDVKVQVRDTKPGGAQSQVTRTLTLTVGTAPTGPRAASSGPMAIDPVNRRLYVVNPDGDTVTALHLDTHAVLFERDLRSLPELAGRRVDPRNVALDAHNQIWISCHDADGVAVLNATTGQPVTFIGLGYGSAPFGVLANPAGSHVYVTLEARGATTRGHGSVVRFAASTRTEVARREVGPWPRAMAMTGDGTRLFVARFVSAENFGQVWEVHPTTLQAVRTIPLFRDRGDRGFDGSSHGAGVPNYVASLTIAPEGTEMWFTAVKASTQRGAFFHQGKGTNQDLTPDHTVRAMVGRIDLATNAEPRVTNWADAATPSARLDIDNSDSPTAVAFSPLGDYAFVTLQGNNGIAVYDRYALAGAGTQGTVWRMPAGAAPQGALIDAATGKLFVSNFLDRDLSVHPLAGFLSVGDRTLAEQRVPTTTVERLPVEVLLGKRIFYHASDRMSHENYISCASCHVDGSHDGRTYDFTQRGEGFRNTTDLRGRGGLAHGNVHWSANFDEIQDFVIDIVNEFGGSGFLPAGESPHPPLGTPNAGRSPDLDALAAYVTSLDHSTLPRSPHRADDGSRPPEARDGAAVFERLNCTTCHAPAFQFTDGTAGTLRDVGTLRTSSGGRLGAPLTGIDTPTLLGAWNTAPYFHDGSAETLADVFTKAGGTVVQAESGTLSSTNTAVIQLRTGDDAIINYDNSFQGEFVEWKTSGASATYAGIHGGAGGAGAIELRYESASARSFTVRVNQTNHVVSVPAHTTRLEWRRALLTGVSFTAGATNTITITSTPNSGFKIDSFTVSTANDLARAEPHRRVLALNATDRANLDAYLLGLDGTEVGGNSLPVITTSTLPTATEHQAYTRLIEAQGGDGARTWTALGLPPGLTLDPLTGTLLGTPTDYGTFAVTLAVTDANGDVATRAYALVVQPASAPPSGGNAFPAITTLALADAVQGQPYTANLAAAGGNAPLTWSLLSGPPGLGVAASTGVLSGTILQAGSALVRVRVSDREGDHDEHTFTLTVRDAYAAWVAARNWHGADSDAGADPDGDGLVNRLEYALNADPLRPDPAPAATRQGDRLAITYVRARAELRYAAETSTDLVTWTTTGVHQGAGAVGEMVTASVPLGPDGQRFLRLRVTD